MEPRGFNAGNCGAKCSVIGLSNESGENPVENEAALPLDSRRVMAQTCSAEDGWSALTLPETPTHTGLPLGVGGGSGLSPCLCWVREDRWVQPTLLQIRLHPDHPGTCLQTLGSLAGPALGLFILLDAIISHLQAFGLTDPSTWTLFPAFSTSPSHCTDAVQPSLPSWRERENILCLLLQPRRDNCPTTSNSNGYSERRET